MFLNERLWWSMNWLSDIVFNAPPSSARARRTRGGATPARAPNSAPARQIRDRATSAEKEMEVDERLRSIILYIFLIIILYRYLLLS